MSDAKRPLTHATQIEQMSTGLVRWRCPNCGQTYFAAPDEAPPDMCHYCEDMTTWQRIHISVTDATVPSRSGTVVLWCCGHCGQQYFDAAEREPPAHCAQCRQHNTFQRIAD